MSRVFLREYSPILKENVQAGSGPTLAVVKRVVLSEASFKNRNGRIYKKQALEEALSLYESTIASRRALGELDHPVSDDADRNGTVILQNVSHAIVESAWDGDLVRGTMEIIDTPCGRIAYSLLSGGYPIGTSSRGFGTVAYEAGVPVVEEYKLVCWDTVSSPSVAKSEMRLSESASPLRESKTMAPAALESLLGAAERALGG